MVAGEGIGIVRQVTRKFGGQCLKNGPECSLGWA